MKKIILLIALLIISFASQAKETINLVCYMSGTDVLTSNKYPTKSEVIKGASTYTIEESNGQWRFQKDNGPIVTSQYDLESVKDNEGELYYSASVKVDERFMEFIVKRRIPSHGNDKDKTRPTSVFDVEETKINRISGQATLIDTVDFKYIGGFNSRTVRNLEGLCTPTAKKF